jgi:hypothetical protein
LTEESDMTTLAEAIKSLPPKQIDKTAPAYLRLVWHRAVVRNNTTDQWVKDLTGAQMGQLKHIRNKLMGAGIDTADTLVLVVENWPTFVHAVLATNGGTWTPEQPDLGFVLKNINVLIEMPA